MINLNSTVILKITSQLKKIKKTLKKYFLNIFSTVI